MEEKLNTFMNIYLIIFNHCFPLKWVLLKEKINNKVHKSQDIINMKKPLDALLVLANVNVNIKNNIYLWKNKQYDSLLWDCKRDQYDKIRTSENKNKCLWNICRKITGKTINKDSTLSGHPQETANKYNQFLLNGIPNLFY